MSEGGGTGRVSSGSTPLRQGNSVMQATARPFVSPTMQRVSPNAYWSPQTQVSVNPETPSFVPQASAGGATASMNTAAPVFVPGGTGGKPLSVLQSSAASAPEFVPGGGGGGDMQLAGEESGAGEGMIPVTHGGAMFFVSDAPGEQNGGPSDPAVVDWTSGTPHGVSLTSSPAPLRQHVGSLNMNPALRLHLQTQALELLRRLEPDDERHKEIPPRYHSIFPLDHESKSRQASGSFGYPSAVFKVVGTQDSVTYALRRFDNVRTTPKIAQVAQDRWGSLRHPNIVALHKCFVYQKALFFVHAYWPTAQTLIERYVGSRQPVPEHVLWSYLIQITAAIRTVHGAGQACRCIGPAHILVTSGSRIRIGGIGVIDVLEYDQVKSVVEHQREDIVSLGMTLLTVASRAIVTPQTINQAMIAIAQQYSPVMQTLLISLITKPPSVAELCGVLASQSFDELGSVYAVADGIEHHLANEFQNGRILKLLVMLGSINERPEYRMDPRWSETGDRYMLKLFRNYLFHQVDEEGQPKVDFGHIIHSLNKLDAGDPEKILLASPDQRAILVVSFTELKQCMDRAFADLYAGHQSNDGLMNAVTEQMAAMQVAAQQSATSGGMMMMMPGAGVPQMPMGMMGQMMTPGMPHPGMSHMRGPGGAMPPSFMPHAHTPQDGSVGKPPFSYGRGGGGRGGGRGRGRRPGR